MVEPQNEQLLIEEIIKLKNGQTQIRQYALGKFLGKGGFAKVYEIIELETNKILAAKITPKSSLKKGRAKEKLLTEITIHRELNHPNVVKCEHYFEDASNVYMLLELCPNETLNHLVKKNRITENEIRTYLKEIVSGVKYLHDNNIVHRDLKLGNLFISKNSTIKIGDFGLAAKLNNQYEVRRTICGTPNYLAPEVLHGQGHSFEVDIWSIGVICYTLLVGKAPFETNNVKKTYQKIKNIEYSFPENTFSEDIKSLINQLLVSDPKKRLTLEDIMEHPFMKEPLVSNIQLVNDPKIKSSMLQSSNMGNKVSPRGSNQQSATNQDEERKTPEFDNKYIESTKNTQHINSRLPSSTRNLNIKPTQLYSTIQKNKSLSPNTATATLALKIEKELQSAKYQPFTEKPKLDQKCENPRQMSGKISPIFPLESQRPTISDSISTNKNVNIYGIELPLKGDINNISPISSSRTNEINALENPLLTHNKDKEKVITTSSLPSPLSNPSPNLRIETSPSLKNVWILKIIDMTNKYGHGYILSNLDIGFLFNDGTSLVLDCNTTKMFYVKKEPSNKTIYVTYEYSVDNFPESLIKKVKVIQEFKKYLEQNVFDTKNGPLDYLKAQAETIKKSTNGLNEAKTLIYIKKYMVARDAKLYRLNNRVIQVNFQDSSSIILDLSTKSMVYLNKKYPQVNMTLNEAFKTENPSIAKRMGYIKQMLLYLDNNRKLAEKQVIQQDQGEDQEEEEYEN